MKNQNLLAGAISSVYMQLTQMIIMNIISTHLKPILIKMMLLTGSE
jgi:hypothetical protein